MLHIHEVLTQSKFKKILVEGTSSWIDDIRTKNKIESLDEILEQAFINGVFDIERLLAKTQIIGSGEGSLSNT